VIDVVDLIIQRLRYLVRAVRRIVPVRLTDEQDDAGCGADHETERCGEAHRGHLEDVSVVRRLDEL